MTDLNQIDAAIRLMNQAIKDAPPESEMTDDDKDTLLCVTASLEALRVYKALLGEPTQKMANAGVDFVDTYKLGDISPLGFRMSPQQLCGGIFKAMSTELIKQVKENKE